MFRSLSIAREIKLIACAVCLATVSATPAKAAFHFWNLNEIYTNSSGTLQFIEFSTTFGGQQFVTGQQITIHNIGDTIQNTFTIPSNLPSDSTNKKFLLGTAGLAAAGGPTPDYIIPSNFLFSAGGSITFFGANPGSYSALPTDGFLSRTWGGGNALNSPTNFAGQSSPVPEPTTMILTPLAAGAMYLVKRRRRGSEPATTC